MKKLDEILKQKHLENEIEERKFQAGKRLEQNIQERKEAEKKQLLEKELEDQNRIVTEKKRLIQNEINSKTLTVFFKLLGCIILCLFSTNIGIINNDGGLFRGFFISILAIVCGFMSIVYIIQFVYFLLKGFNNQ